MMIKEDVGMMPVIQDSKVAGMVRLSDLFKEISDYGVGRIILFLGPFTLLRGVSCHGGRY